MLAAGPVSRILSAGKLRGKPKPAVKATYHRTTIPLGRASLRGSSDLPEGLAHRAGTRPGRKLALPAPDFLPIWSCSVWGLPCPRHCWSGGALLPHLFTLTPALPPWRYVFCGTSRQPALRPASRTLSGTLLCGVRTFLFHHLTRQKRPSGPAAYDGIIIPSRTRQGGPFAPGEYGQPKKCRKFHPWRGDHFPKRSFQRTHASFRAFLFASLASGASPARMKPCPASS